MSYRQVGCKGKRSYTSWAAAEKEAKRVRRQTEEGIHPYRCKACSFVHLGSGHGVKDQRAAQRRFARYVVPLPPKSGK
jgi:hypothetical protein